MVEDQYYYGVVLIAHRMWHIPMCINSVVESTFIWINLMLIYVQFARFVLHYMKTVFVIDFFV